MAESDFEVGRILDALKHSGQLDNTLVIYLMGDNGASAEGTLHGTTSKVSGQYPPESMEFLTSMIDQLGSDRTGAGWQYASRNASMRREKFARSSTT